MLLWQNTAILMKIGIKNDISYRHWQTLECLEYKITDNTAIIHMHTRSERVEYTSYTYLNMILETDTFSYNTCHEIYKQHMPAYSFTKILNTTNPALFTYISKLFFLYQ